MRVLVACEFSGVVRDAFRERGHDAVSCDLLPTERPGPHHQGDVRELLGDGWDLLIAHPPCTYLANSGVRWLHSRPERWAQMADAVAFFAELYAAPIARRCIENPIMHGYARGIVGRCSQTVHPWQFGHSEQKATCLWLEGLPPLWPTKVMAERRYWLEEPGAGPERWKLRSRTYPGIAAAMASQWGGV